MDTFLRRLFRRFFSPLLLMVAAFAVLYAPGNAGAAPYVLTVQQRGSDVVATGNGQIDLTGLTYVWGWQIVASLNPSFGLIATGPADWFPMTDYYMGVSGPASFGSGSATVAATTGQGDPIMFVGGTRDHISGIYVPWGYVSGTPLSSTATWANTTLADLGVTPGVYTWTWGSVDITSGSYMRTQESEACQSVTVIVGDVTGGGGDGSCGGQGGNDPGGGGGGVIAVPEPSTLGMFGLGTLLVIVGVALRRRTQEAW